MASTAISACGRGIEYLNSKINELIVQLGPGLWGSEACRHEPGKQGTCKAVPCWVLKLKASLGRHRTPEGHIYTGRVLPSLSSTPAGVTATTSAARVASRLDLKAYTKGQPATLGR